MYVQGGATPRLLKRLPLTSAAPAGTQPMDYQDYMEYSDEGECDSFSMQALVRIRFLFSFFAHALTTI